jgi:tetraacyldisaccharide 4'-kinase
LTFGGTGKTPVTIAMARLLLELGQRPAVLLRGYGRSTRGARRVGPCDLPSDVGDEALLLARSLPGVPVAVAERREEAAELVRGDCTLFLLDDGFQHLRVRRDLDLLLVDATRPGDLRAPPVGRLREGISAAGRAHVILVTRGSEADLPQRLAPFSWERPLLGVRFLWETKPLGQEELASWSDLKGRTLACFAGVGHPEAFFEQALRHGLTLSSLRIFPDHATPDPTRLRMILRDAQSHAARAVLTTEKDAVKWAPLWPSDAPPLLFPRLRVELAGDVDGLRALLARSCSAGPR